MIKKGFILSLAIGLWIAGTGVPQSFADEKYEPEALFLTWQNDPTTTMTIDWHTVPGEKVRPPALLYREKDSDREWKKTVGTLHAFPYTSRTISRVELTGLNPGTMYEFQIGPPASERYPFVPSKTYAFRTMPDQLDEPIRVAVGGDNGVWTGFPVIAYQAMQHDIDFVALGGDLAYSDGGDRDWRTDDEGFLYPYGGEAKSRWIDWFDIVNDQLITEEGRVIPVLTGIGNHEVWRAYTHRHEQYQQTDEWRERIAPFYYNLFAFPGQPGYAVLDFSDYMSWIFLDSGHSNPVEGEQTAWLEQVLAERTNVSHVYPIYHIASFPTVRNFDSEIQTVMRKKWGSLFEQYNIEVAFENHDHTYKRTYPIRNGEIDPEGVVYMGDGAFGLGEVFGRGGRGDRIHDVDDTWYLKRVASDAHFILLTLDSNGARYEAINYTGDVIDRYPEE